MKNLKYLLGPMRLPFLVLPPACVLLGIAVAVHDAGRVSLVQDRKSACRDRVSVPV
jgi:hypothetical protein